MAEPSLTVLWVMEGMAHVHRWKAPEHPPRSKELGMNRPHSAGIRGQPHLCP